VSQDASWTSADFAPGSSTEIFSPHKPIEPSLSRISEGSSRLDAPRISCPEIEPDDVELEDEKIGQGAFSVVYKGVWRGCDVVVKKPVDPRAAMDPKLQAEFYQEAAVLRFAPRRRLDPRSDLRHPNIVLMMAATLKPPKLFLVFEWVDGNSLYDVVHLRSK
jgi:hypothetical protein